MSCPSTTEIAPGVVVQCGRPNYYHYQCREEHRTRHRYYVGGSQDTEVTWEDPL